MRTILVMTVWMTGAHGFIPGPPVFTTAQACHAMIADLNKTPCMGSQEGLVCQPLEDDCHPRKVRLLYDDLMQTDEAHD